MKLTPINYYPFGMPMPGRSYRWVWLKGPNYSTNPTDVIYSTITDLQDPNTIASEGSDYRYGFNAHEKDDEVKGKGNHLSFGDFGYDPRLGRRWNIDPILKYWESSYATFRNSPLYYMDPSGLDGEGAIDKEKKTIDIEANFYYDKSQSVFSDLLITEDQTHNGTIWKSQVSGTQENGWSSQSWSVTDEDGTEWTVNYKINFIGLDNSSQVEQKLKDDPMANKLIYQGSMLEESGQWDPNTRTLALGSKAKPDGSTLTHEVGHALGLPHSYEIPGTPHYGSKCQIDDCEPQLGHNGYGDMTGSIMSYARQRSIYSAEVRMNVIRAVNVANTVKEKIVNVHIKGYNTDPTIIKK